MGYMPHIFTRIIFGVTRGYWHFSTLQPPLDQSGVRMSVASPVFTSK